MMTIMGKKLVQAVLFTALVWAGVVYMATHGPAHNVPVYPTLPGQVQAAKPVVWNADYAKRFANCVPADDPRLADEVVVVNPQRTRAYRESFAVAWQTNHDAAAENNLWVVGKCF